MEFIEYYYDEFCCNDLECIIEGRICDTYGGDYCLMDVYICTKCNKAFEVFFGGRFDGIKEVYDKDDKEYYMSFKKE